MPKLSNKNVLVTGGAGFIGSALCERFLEQGNKLTCLDSLITGHLKNIEPFLENPDFTFIEGDIRDPETCKKACDGKDYVFHQAALGSVPRSIENPQRTNEININGFLNMLVAARDAGVKRFVFASSSSVYGDAPKLPKFEDAIGEPLSPYAVTKLVNEKYATVFSDVYGMETAGLRYFNVFGRRQDPDGAYAAVIPKWVKQMMQHEAPIINGDGNYSRDFTYIDNVIHANEQAAIANRKIEIPDSGFQIPDSQTDNSEQDSNIPTFQHSNIPHIYNVAFGGNITLNQLFVALRDNLAKFDPEIGKLEPVYGPVRPGDIPHSMASIDRARQQIGYNPQYDAIQGFEKACEWYWENLG